MCNDDSFPARVDSGLQKLLQKMSVALTLADGNQADTPLVAANDAFLEFCGYARTEVIGRNCRFLQGDHDNTAARGEINDAMAARRRVQVLLRNRHKDGREITNFLTIVPISVVGEAASLFLGTQFELTEGERAGLDPVALLTTESDLSGVMSRHRALMLERRRVKIEATVRMVESHLLMRGLRS